MCMTLVIVIELKKLKLRMPDRQTDSTECKNISLLGGILQFCTYRRVCRIKALVHGRSRFSAAKRYRQKHFHQAGLSREDGSVISRHQQTPVFQCLRHATAVISTV